MPCNNAFDVQALNEIEEQFRKKEKYGEGRGKRNLGGGKGEREMQQRKDSMAEIQQMDEVLMRHGNRGT